MGHLVTRVAQNSQWLKMS